jgi:hypothetical protein
MDTCKTCLIGKIATIIGAVCVLYGILLAFGLFWSRPPFGITAGGALNGAMAFFLMAIAFYLWPCDEIVEVEEVVEVEEMREG